MNKWVERFYERSPVVVQHAMISAYGLRLKRARYGGRFKSYLEELERTERYSEHELEELQNEKLRTLIRHCYENVPYYWNLFRELNLTPADFRTAADLPKLPILEKETVRSQPELFHARNFLNKPREVVGTSGTTGTTLKIHVDLEGRRRNYAFFARLKRWAGVSLTGRVATFAGRTIVSAGTDRPPFWRYNLAGNTILFSSYHLSEKNLPAYLSKLCAWNPELIDSYPSSVETLARYVLAHGSRAPQPHAIITSSETLRADQREAICAAFRTRIFDQYGSAEQVCFISECEAGSYHIHPEYGITEFLAGNGADPEAGLRIVATGFTNMAMPFLRYNTGDLAVPGSASCLCGRKFKTVEQIVGREDDMLVTPDGRPIGRLDPVFKGLETIRRAQIVQESLQRIVVRVVPGNGFHQTDLDGIRHELDKRIGPGVDYSFEVMDEISPSRGGKFRAVVSHVINARRRSPPQGA
jgi:phenylacetate-CoA ligase